MSAKDSTSPPCSLLTRGILAHRTSMSSITSRRILQEAKEIANNPTEAFWAAPTEESIFEWHFVIRGAKGTDFEDGRFHGRILLPPNYPLRPPAFKFSHVNGRFEVNREICLSISRFHESSWSAAWGIRTAILALIAFMPTKAEGAIGGIDMQVNARKEICRDSSSYVCRTCGKANIDLLPSKEAIELADTMSQIPSALSFVYHDSKPAEKQTETAPSGDSTNTPTAATTAPARDSSPDGSTIHATPSPTTQPSPQVDHVSRWIDLAILILFFAITSLIVRQIM